jgi:hypothetical protein
VIGYVDMPPTVEPYNGGFIVTIASGETETQLFLTLHAMTALCERGRLGVKEAQAKAAFAALPFKAEA